MTTQQIAVQSLTQLMELRHLVCDMRDKQKLLKSEPSFINKEIATRAEKKVDIQLVSILLQQTQSPDQTPAT